MLSREKRIWRAYNRSEFLTVQNEQYADWLIRFFAQKMDDDMGERGDLTSELLSQLVDSDEVIETKVIAKQDGVIAGVEEITFLAETEGINVKTALKDGSHVTKKDIVIVFSAPFHKLLTCERLFIDILGRMSGIATVTNKYVRNIEDMPVALAATRKTFWSFLDKKAVEIGGGFSHRLGLFDAVLIKENHISALEKLGGDCPLETFIGNACKLKHAAFIECEVETSEQCLQVSQIFHDIQSESGEERPCVIMLDNFSPEQIKTVIADLKAQHLYDGILLESSGNISDNNLREYASTGVDVISIGSLTHSVSCFDFSMIAV